MNRKPLPKFRKGDVLTAADLSILRDAIERQRLTTGQNSGISLQETEQGTLIRIASRGDRYLAKTSSTITARSGTTAGTGTVTLQQVKGTTISSLGVDYDVLNFSSTTGGIPTATYCWIEQDPNGNFWVTSVDCGN